MIEKYLSVLPGLALAPYLQMTYEKLAHLQAHQSQPLGSLRRHRPQMNPFHPQTQAAEWQCLQKTSIVAPV